MGKVKQIKGKALASRPTVTRNVRPPAIRGTTRTADTTSPSRRSSGRPTNSKGRGMATGGPVGKEEVKQPTSSGKSARVGSPGAAPREIRVRELVPEKVCGPRTRVQQVFRVEERVNGSSQTHLVFNDRHGWYCEHGPDCPAVGAVRGSGKSTAARNSAWTTNGRMRE